MSEESARSFVEQVRGIAAAAAPLPRDQALEALRQRVHAILTRELKFAEVEWSDRRNLTFAIEDRYYQFVFDENDPEFLALYSGTIAAFKDEPGRLRALQIASSTTKDAKVGKIYAYPVGSEWFVAASAEVLLPSLEAVDKSFIRRLVRMLTSSIGEFRSRYAQPDAPRP